MKTTSLKSDILMLIASAIWGLAFVAQRIGMEYVGPFVYNGIRFALGSLFLLPFDFIKWKKNKSSKRKLSISGVLPGSILAGIVLFSGATLQQIGMINAPAGKAGFITGLYVILVPIFGIFIRKKTYIGTWVGAVLAVAGLYFLSINSTFSLSSGEFLILCSAVFWAVHLHIVDNMSSRISSVLLAIIQFSICSILSLIISFFLETTKLSAIYAAALPILYGGFLSVGIAYTLQVVAQKEAHPAHAAIILSLEGVFALLGGIILLSETITLEVLFGCFLMLSGMLVSQMKSFLKQKERSINK